MTQAATRTPAKLVLPNAIPGALRAIWRDCCATAPASDVSRALILNFIVVAEAARERELRPVLDALAARQPCRAFLITLDEGCTELRATVFGAARVHGAVRELVLEQIELHAPAGAFDRLAGLIRPLLVSDLPTHMYWAADWPADAGPFEQFAGLAEHTIVDSTRFPEPAASIAALEQRRQRGLHITDLTWLRLRPWRRSLAEGLERIRWSDAVATTVTIRHGAAGIAAAALLRHWLEQKLRGKVVLESRRGAHAACDEVELRHGDQVVAATLVETGLIEVTVTTAESCFLPFHVPASRGTEGGLLAAAIDLA